MEKRKKTAKTSGLFLIVNNSLTKMLQKARKNDKIYNSVLQRRSL